MSRVVAILVAVVLVSVGGCGVKRHTVSARPSTARPVLLEFYWLKDIQSSNNPVGQWRMEMMPGNAKGYLFTNPKGKTIDSLAEPQKVMDQVVRAKQNPPVLTGRDLLPNAEANVNPRNLVVINIEFNKRGTKVFREFTRRHVGDYLAVFCDGKLLTAPSINEAIPSGKAEITGFTNLAEARRMADGINASASGVTPGP